MAKKELTVEQVLERQARQQYSQNQWNVQKPINRQRKAQRESAPEGSIIDAIQRMDYDFEPDCELDVPTQHRPGSTGKVAVLERRVKKGLNLWHPEDAATNGHTQDENKAMHLNHVDLQ